jgi:hypothetical protein
LAAEGAAISVSSAATRLADIDDDCNATQ